MKYTTPEIKIDLIETRDVITASVQIEASEDKTDIFATADQILNQIFGI